MLVDSNILIYALKPDGKKLLTFLFNRMPAVSAITYVEVLGTTKLSMENADLIRRMFTRLSILPLDQPVLEQAIVLRQQRKMGLGDALIAATALVHSRTLVTRNTADFAWVNGLRLLDPFLSGE
ncbi:MAG: type II toxin-antitoxin system VapC family toxin [Candidatus Promineofilum sp.]|nr:type II toxin-antitoxin system VapC family toxin [Promineifilum sp.]